MENCIELCRFTK